MLHLTLLFIITGVNSNSECDCNTITSVQDFMKKELFQIRFENSRIISWLRRLEVSSKHFLTTNHQQPDTGPDQNVGKSVSNDQSSNNSKRIDAIESTLARVVTQLKLKVPITEKSVQDDGQNQRLDKIETELTSVSNKIDQIIDVNNLSKSMVLKFCSSLKRTFRAEKTNRVKFEIDIQEKVKSVLDYSRNFTGETGLVIDRLKNEVMQKHEKFKEEMNSESTKINQTVYKHIHDMDSSFLNLQNHITTLENATVKDETDGGWSNWGSFSTCSDSCGVGVKVRSRTCTNPKPSLKGQYCEGTTVQSAVCNKNTCPEYRVSFTAYDIIKTEGDRVDAIFSKIYQNYGGGYDRSTGKFTCKIPGTYMFSFQITKVWGMKTDCVVCDLYKNGDRIIGAAADPYGNDEDGYSISLTGTFHLSKNDVVYVGQCVGLAFAFSGIYSSFTGVLITPDA